MLNAAGGEPARAVCGHTAGGEGCGCGVSRPACAGGCWYFSELTKNSPFLMVFARWESNFQLKLSPKVISDIRMQNLLLIIGIIKMPCARFRRILIVAFFFPGVPLAYTVKKRGYGRQNPV